MIRKKRYIVDKSLKQSDIHADVYSKTKIHREVTDEDVRREFQNQFEVSGEVLDSRNDHHSNNVSAKCLIVIVVAVCLAGCAGTRNRDLTLDQRQQIIEQIEQSHGRQLQIPEGLDDDTWRTEVIRQSDEITIERSREINEIPEFQEAKKRALSNIILEASDE
jgi:hypothetical protein